MDTPALTPGPAPAGRGEGKPFGEGDSNPNSSARRQTLQAENRELRARVAELEGLLAARERAEADRDPEGGVVTAVRMRKVLGQPAGADAGPTEQVLRVWLEKNPRDYIRAAEEKEEKEAAEIAECERLEAKQEQLLAEQARLKAQLAELEAAEAVVDDPGTDAALGLIEKLLVEAGSDVGPDGRCKACGQMVPAKAAGVG